MIPGIDVSHWQYDIDWSELKRSGVRFAFIKATEFPDKKTSLFVDNKCQENIASAKANGIHWGAYHFFRTHIDPVIQAQKFCETVGAFSSLPPVLDLEAAGSKGERLNHKVRSFLEEVEKITNRRPIVYTSGGFWRSYMAFEKLAHTDWAAVYPLWMAQYTNLWPSPLYPWTAWDFWQYSDHGKLPGIKTDVDLNWFAGSEADLIEKYISPKKADPKVYVFEDEELGEIRVPIRKHTHTNNVNAQEIYPENQERTETPVKETGFKSPQVPKEIKYPSDQQNWIKEYFF